MTPVLFSVSYSGSWGQARLSVDEFVEHAAALGYKGVMLGAKRPHLSPLDYDAVRLHALKRKIRDIGLERVIVAGYTNFTADLEHADVPSLEIQIQHVVQLIRLAHELDAPLVRVFTGYESAAKPFGAQWDLVVEALRECSRRAAPLGVTIGVQNHHDIGVDPDAQIALIDAVGESNCRPLFDAWAPALQGTDPYQAAQRMGGLTPHTTLANYVLQKRFRYQPDVLHYRPEAPYAAAVPIDEGFIDYPRFWQALAEGGFRGTVAYEMCSPIRGGGSIENLDRYARRFLEYFGSWLESARLTAASQAE